MINCSLTLAKVWEEKWKKNNRDTYTYIRKKGKKKSMYKGQKTEEKGKGGRKGGLYFFVLLVHLLWSLSQKGV